MTLTKIAIVLAISAIGVAQGQDPNAQLDSYKGKPIPAFRLTDIHGKTVTNRSLLGKVYVLDFWATWCGACKAASPVMQKLYSKFGSRGFEVIGVQTKNPDAPNGARDYAKEHRFTYTFTKNDDTLTDKLGIQALPALVIVGKDGRVVRIDTGMPTKIDDLYTSFGRTIRTLL